MDWAHFADDVEEKTFGVKRETSFIVACVPVDIVGIVVVWQNGLISKTEGKHQVCLIVSPVKKCLSPVQNQCDTVKALYGVGDPFSGGIIRKGFTERVIKKLVKKQAEPVKILSSRNTQLHHHISSVRTDGFGCDIHEIGNFFC